MKFKKPANENYCATVVQIKNIFPLEKCDNIQGTTIFGNPVIIGKDVIVGQIGIFFTAETQLSDEYAKENNLYRHAERNEDTEKKGYLDDNRRIRTMKMRGNQSCGLFMPLESMEKFFKTDSVFNTKIGTIFDEVDGTPICNKYITKKRGSNLGGSKKSKKPKLSKLVKDQFRFHYDTGHFGKNVHKFDLNTIVSITSKIHGTSLVSSRILCKKKLGLFNRLLKKIGIRIIDTGYENIFSSRRVVKNDDINTTNHYYNENIWQLANDKLKEFISDGISLYAEIVGFTPDGGYIQKGYDYGCTPRTFDVYIYRITYTNPSGDVFEFSMEQIQEWCAERGLKAVPLLFHDRIGMLWQWLDDSGVTQYDNELTVEENILNQLKELYLEKPCKLCKNKVPDEGVVIRKGNEAFKLKSFAFMERETKQLDKGTADMEEEN